VHEGIRGLEAQRAVRAVFIVSSSMLLEQYPSLVDAGEELAVEKLIAKPTVEALHVPVLPRAARSDEERADTSPAKPTPERVGDELGTVVRTDVNRNPVDLEQNAKRLMNIHRCKAPTDLQGETPPSELVDDHEDLHPPSVHGLLGHEVVAPDMVQILRPVTNASLI
jgi:hypothetical protein